MSAPAQPAIREDAYVNFGIALKEKMDELGIEADLKYPGAAATYESVADFMIAKLRRG